MKLLDDVTLVLLDFDGLLVDTEKLHFFAYKNMCLSYGLVLPWTFQDFCTVAHKSSFGLKEKMYLDLPELFKIQPDWSSLYAQKKDEYKKILLRDTVELLPGVSEFLALLEQKQLAHAVVTNSPREQIDAIKHKIPQLASIQHWYTREDYKHPKPEPDGYLKALSDLSVHGDKVIGFEDTYRGFCALHKACIRGIVISDLLTDDVISSLKEKGAEIYPSFSALLSQA